MRRENAARDTLPVPSDAEWTLPTSWRAEYGAENSGRDRAYPAGRDETRALLEAGKRGAG
jgi:hypothetical protein